MLFKRGFTTIEMIIVMAIIAILLSVLVSYSRSGEKQIILFKEQTQIISILTRTKSLSLATYGAANVPCGYGVHFDQASKAYWMFKDLSVPAVGGDCSTADNIYSGAAEDIGEKFKLSDQIEFNMITSNDILFIPPSPLIIIGGNSAINELLIEVNIVGAGDSIGIKASKSGQITTF
jgi:prepilin-type N-terminal cleavage/methylation domain-containing protein